MPVAIIRKSDLDKIDNWSSIIFTKAESLLKEIPEDLSPLNIKLLIEKNIGILKSNEFSLISAIKYERELIFAIMGGVTNDFFVTKEKILDYCLSKKSDMAYYRRALLITMVLIYSIKEHELELLEYIQSEVLRWQAFEVQIKNVINSQTFR